MTTAVRPSSGEISRVEYDEDYDLATLGHPWDADDYEFTSGTLTHAGKDVEFSVQLNKTTGQFSVSATELLEGCTKRTELPAPIEKLCQSVTRRCEPCVTSRAARRGSARGSRNDSGVSRLGRGESSS